jgi:hypothetical protein
MSSTAIHCCRICGARPPVAIVETAAGVVLTPSRFHFVYREEDRPLGLCDFCFAARHFDGFTVDEIAYFEEEFTKPIIPDDTPDAS